MNKLDNLVFAPWVAPANSKVSRKLLNLCVIAHTLIPASGAQAACAGQQHPKCRDVTQGQNTSPACTGSWFWVDYKLHKKKNWQILSNNSNSLDPTMHRQTCQHFLFKMKSQVIRDGLNSVEAMISQRPFFKRCLGLWVSKSPRCVLVSLPQRSDHWVSSWSPLLCAFLLHLKCSTC